MNEAIQLIIFLLTLDCPGPFAWKIHGQGLYWVKIIS